MAERARTEAEYAVKVALNLMTTSAAFASTNDPATSILSAPPSPPRVSLQRPYKALVVLYFGGGADTFNLLIPHSDCDGRNVSEQCARAPSTHRARAHARAHPCAHPKQRYMTLGLTPSTST